MNKAELSNSKNIIGIPRAMSYYNNYPFYYGFFEALGCKVVISDKTTEKIINEGSKYVVSETCLPIKVYVGHVMNLLSKGITTVFVPSICSVDYKINNCSKIRGLSEIIRNVIKKPFRMIEGTIDKTENIGIRDFCIEIANQLDIFDKKLIEYAMKCGWEKYNNFIEMSKAGLPFKKALENSLENVYENKKIELVKPLSVVLIAHGYNLFDEKVSMNLLKKLEQMNVKVYTSLNVSKDEAVNAIYKLGEVRYWANELDLTGTAAYFLNNANIDGIIALSTFGCGPDSLMVDEIKYHADIRKKPMLHLIVDEHTGEAGFITRLEAFIDMIIRKKRFLLEKSLSESKKYVQSDRTPKDKELQTTSLV